MPFAPHIRVTAIGTLGALNNEMFQYRVCISNGGTGTVADYWNQHFVDAAEELADDVADFHGRPNSAISSQAILQTVKAAYIGADGKYVGEARVYPRVMPGGVTHASYVLPQNALAISLNTALDSPRGRGRFFIPMPIVTPDAATGFLVPLTTVEAIRGSAEQFIEALNNHPGIDPVVANPQVVVASTTGINSPVTSVRIGRIVDTIRSRRNRLPEAYIANADVD